MASVPQDVVPLLNSTASLSPLECVVDVGFALDGSGSVTRVNWMLMLVFVSKFSRSVQFGQSGTRIGVVSYGNAAILNVTLDQFDDGAAFENTVRSIRYKDENTNTAAGIRMLRQQVFNTSRGDRANVMNVAIILTDGASTWEKNRTIPEATLLKNEGARVFAIGISDKINMEELHAIASDPSDYYVSIVDQFTDLDRIFTTIVNLTCGIHPDIPTTTELVTTPTTTTTRAPQGPNRIDLAFLLDSSGSVGYDNWLLTKAFAKTFTNALTLGRDAVEVAVVEYSTQSFLRVPLGEYSDHGALDNAIEQLGHLNQRTNTSGAIRTANQVIFTGNDRDRPDATDVMFVITDGASNTDGQFLEREAKRARDRGIKVFALSVGNKTNMNELQKIASKPYFYYMHMISDFDKLEGSWSKVESKVAEEVYPTSEHLPVSLEDCPTDMVMLMDVSASMASEVLELIDDLSKLLTPVDQQYVVVAATAQTNQEARVIGENLAGSLQYIREKIFSETDLEGDRPEAQNVVTLLTTGNYNNPDEVVVQMEALKAAGIKVYVIALGVSASDGILRDLTSEPKENTFADLNNFEGNRNANRDLDVLNSFTREICTIASRTMWSCSFEPPEPDRCNLIDDGNAEFRWTVTNRRTPSRHTGPDNAYSGQFFAFIEASSPRRIGDRAIMYLPFSSEGTFCLSFWYHMKGWHIGVLDVFVMRDGRETLLWRTGGPQSDSWLYGKTLLILREGDEIGIRGIRAKAFSGDIGLDALAISKGPCPGNV